MGDYLGPYGALLIYVLPIVVMLFVLNRMGKKRKEVELARRESALVVGKWVLTRAGFYGRIVEIDGDVVVLETILGDESMWDSQAIVMQKNPPLSPDSTLLAEPNEVLPETDPDNSTDLTNE